MSFGPKSGSIETYWSCLSVDSTLTGVDWGDEGCVSPVTPGHPLLNRSLCADRVLNPGPETEPGKRLVDGKGEGTSTVLHGGRNRSFFFLTDEPGPRQFPVWSSYQGGPGVAVSRGCLLNRLRREVPTPNRGGRSTVRTIIRRRIVTEDKEPTLFDKPETCSNENVVCPNNSELTFINRLRLTQVE